MSVPSLARIVGFVVCVLLFASAAVVSDTGNRGGSRVARSAAIPEIILELDSTEVPVADSGAWMNLYLTNPLHAVGGFEIYLLLDGIHLFEFHAETVIDTTITCIDTLDCDPADTAIDTSAVSALDTVGTAISGWGLVESRVLSPINLRLVALSDPPGGDSIPPLATGGPRLLTRVWLHKTVPSAILDTLTERTSHVFVDAPQTRFSDPDGALIGQFDSALFVDSFHCVDTPTCDTIDTFTYLDTLFFFDTTAFVYLPGARTFGPSCLLGDVNATGDINASDIIALVNYVFRGGDPPVCSPNAADVTCSGTTDASDIIFLVGYVFKGGPAPPAGC